MTGSTRGSRVNEATPIIHEEALVAQEEIAYQAGECLRAVRPGLVPRVEHQRVVAVGHPLPIDAPHLWRNHRVLRTEHDERRDPNLAEPGLGFLAAGPAQSRLQRTLLCHDR